MDINDKSTYDDPFVFNHSWCKTDSQTIAAITKYLFENYKTSNLVTEIKSSFIEYFRNVFKKLQSDDKGGITLTDEAKEYIPSGFEELLEMDKVMKFVDHDKLCNIVSYFNQRFSAGLESDSDKKELSSIFVGMYQIIMHAVVKHSSRRIEDLEFLTWQSNSITKDMLLFDSYDDRSPTTTTMLWRSFPQRSRRFLCGICSTTNISRPTDV